MNSFMSWVGGKKSLRDAVLARFPPYYERYIEVFGGAGWILFHPIHRGTTELQRQADMRIKLQNVECEFQVSVVSGQRNVYVPATTAVSTSDMKTLHFAFVRWVTRKFI